MKKKVSFTKSMILAVILCFAAIACTNETIPEAEDQHPYLTAKALKGSKFNFTSSLKGGNEVPAVDTNAAGHVSVKISKDETSLSYKITAANLDNVIAAHFHIAPVGENGGVVAFLHSHPNQPSGPQNGILAEGVITEANLIGSLAGNFEGLLEAIRSGNVYVNVHSQAVPSGEIRGQL
jgi:hypothetical protein